MGLIPDTIIAQVIDRTDLVALINNYTPLKKAGRNYKALCPFHHEKSPSFVVNPDKQIFHCFGCGVGGNAVAFLMKLERLEFPQAVRQLADKCGIVIPEDDNPAAHQWRGVRDRVFEANGLAVQFFHQELLSSKSSEANNARQYLKQRGVSLETVKTFQLGFSPSSWDGLLNVLKAKGFDEAFLVKAGLIIARENNSGYYDRFRNRVMFPIFDIQSRCVAFGARTLNDKDGAKYINSPETPVYTKGQHVFGLNITKPSIGKLDRVIVVEGYMDMIIPYVAGVSNTVAALGTALTVEQIRLIRRFTPNITMLFDTDSAGQSAMIRSLDLLVDEDVNVNVVSLAANEDPDSFIRQHGLDAFNKRLEQAQTLFDYKFDWLNRQLKATTAEGKSQISQGMLATINRYQDAVVKFELIKQLAAKLQVPQGVLEQQAQGIKGNFQSAPLVQTPVVNKTAKLLSKTEETLLMLLLTDPLLIPAAQGKLSVDDFDNEVARRIVGVLFELSVNGHELSINEVIGRLSDEESVNLVAKLVSGDEALLVERQRQFDDCVWFLKKNQLKTARIQLEQELKTATHDQRKNDILHEMSLIDKKLKGGNNSL